MTTTPTPSPTPFEKLEILFREYSPEVYRAAYRITGQSGDADDVVQTVFLRLHRSGGVEKLSDQPAAYLYRAAINAGLDLVRKRGRVRELGLSEIGPNQPEEQRDLPHKQLMGQEIKMQLRDAVARLSEKSAEVFALRYFEGFDNKTIAETLGTSASVIGVTLHRARRKVEQELKKMGSKGTTS